MKVVSPKTKETAIGMDGNLDLDRDRENRWKWQLDSSFEVGSIRYPVALGNAMHYQNQKDKERKKNHNQ